MKLKPIPAKFCPVCKSTRIALWGATLASNYKCNNCDYIGPIVLEDMPIKSIKDRKPKKVFKSSKIRKKSQKR